VGLAFRFLHFGPQQLTKYILDCGFNPKQRLPVARFNAGLRHPNAFSSLTREQCAATLVDGSGATSPQSVDDKT
jgi:hypothetical protein